MHVPGGIPLVPKQPQSCSKHTKAAAQHRYLAIMEMRGGGSYVKSLLDARGPKITIRSIVSKNLAMEESPSLKEKQALRFDEKFYFWLARGDLDHTLYLNTQKGTSFEILEEHITWQALELGVVGSYSNR